MSNTRADIIEDIQLNLGGLMIDIELEEKHYNKAIDFALDRYRQRSGNAVEETFVFMDIQPDVNIYTLPNEVQIVREVLRRNITGSGVGGQFEPFGAAFANNVYQMSGAGGGQQGGSGFLATYDAAMQYQELLRRMFGGNVQFAWNKATKKLTLHQRFRAVEQIALHCYALQTEDVLFADVDSRTWLREYATARAKMMLGQAKSQFGSYAGPQGGITMNGDALKQEATAEMLLLDTELKDTVDGSSGYGFTIG